MSLNWVRRAITSTISAFTESPRTPQDDLDDLWKDLVNDHHDLVQGASEQELDNPLRLIKAKLERHVAGMVGVLKEEAKRNPDGVPSDSVEFILERNVVQLFFELGHEDRPLGMLALCVDAVDKLLQACPSLLPNMPVHSAINFFLTQWGDDSASCLDAARRLRGTPGSPGEAAARAKMERRAKMTQRGQNRIAVASLLLTVWRAIKESPGLLTFFLDYRSVQRGSNAEAKRLVSPDGKAAIRTRRQFALLHPLILLLKEPPKTGMHAREALLTAMMVQDVRITDYLARRTFIVQDAVTALADRFNMLPMDWENAAPDELLVSEQFKVFLPFLRFYNSLVVVGADLRWSLRDPGSRSSSVSGLTHPTSTSPVPEDVGPHAPHSPLVGPAAAGGTDTPTLPLDGLGTPVSGRGQLLSPTGPPLDVAMTFADMLLDTVIHSFLISTLMPCLQHSSDVRARAATVYVHGIVADLARNQLDHRLLDLVVRFLLGDTIATEDSAFPFPGDFGGPSRSASGEDGLGLYASGARAGTSMDRVHGDDDIYAFPATVFTTLLARLDAPNEELAQSTAGLFAELLAVNSDVAMDRMILSTLAPYAGVLEEQVWRGPSWEQLGIVSGEEVDAASSAAGDGASSGGEEDSPGAAARAQGVDAAGPTRVPSTAALLSPSLAMAALFSPPHGAARLHVNTGGSISVAKRSPSASVASEDVCSVVSAMSEPTVDPVEVQAYVMDAEKGVLSAAVAFGSWTGGKDWCRSSGSPVSRAGAAVGGAAALGPRCPFLEAVLHKLGSMLTRPKASNLVLTGIIAKVAQCPDPLVHAYLFPAAALRGDPAPWPNVVTTLRKLWEEALRRAARIPDFGVAVRAARARFVAEVEDTSVAARRTLDMEAARACATLPRERRVFIEAYVVLEEFVKEVTALLDVRCRILSHISRWASEGDAGGSRAGAGGASAGAGASVAEGEGVDEDVAVTDAYFQELLDGKHEPAGVGAEEDVGPPPVPPPKALRSLF